MAAAPALFETTTGGALAGKPSQWTDDDVIKALPGTRADVAKKLKMSTPTATRRVRRLHERKLVHVSKWIPATGAPGPWQAVYTPGAGVDAAHPPKYVAYKPDEAAKARQAVKSKAQGEWAGMLGGALFGRSNFG